MDLIDYRWYVRTQRIRLMLDIAAVFLMLLFAVLFVCAPIFKIIPNGSETGTSFSFLGYWVVMFFAGDSAPEWFSVAVEHMDLSLFCEIFPLFFVWLGALLPLGLTLQIFNIVTAGTDMKIFLYENYLHEKYNRYLNALTVGNRILFFVLFTTFLSGVVLPLSEELYVIVDFFVPQTLPHTLQLNMGWMIVLGVLLIAIIVIFKICFNLVNKQITYAMHDIRKIIADQNDEYSEEVCDENEH